MRWDIETKELEYVTPYSDLYNESYWGSVFKYIPSLDVSLDKKSLIINYPVDPKLYKSNYDGTVLSSHYEASSYVDKIREISEAVRVDHSVPNMKKKEYSLTNSDFNKIITDHQNKLYYRISYLRPTLEQLRSGRFNPHFSMDQEFNKRGEKYFDGNIFRPSMVFVGHRGLYIGRTDLYSENEDILL